MRFSLKKGLIFSHWIVKIHPYPKNNVNRGDDESKNQLRSIELLNEKKTSGKSSFDWMTLTEAFQERLLKHNKVTQHGLCKEWITEPNRHRLKISPLTVYLKFHGFLFTLELEKREPWCGKNDILTWFEHLSKWNSIAKAFFSSLKFRLR